MQGVEFCKKLELLLVLKNLINQKVNLFKVTYIFGQMILMGILLHIQKPLKGKICTDIKIKLEINYSKILLIK